MSIHVFIDESVRRRYLLCAVTVTAVNVPGCRREVARFCWPGQRRIHFVKENPGRRRQLLAHIVGLPVVAYFYESSGHHVEARRDCLRGMMIALADQPVTRCVIESGDAEDHRDRQTASEMVCKVPWLQGTYLEHMKSYEEPMLWISDALAWSYSAGGEWRERIRPLTGR